MKALGLIKTTLKYFNTVSLSIVQNLCQLVLCTTPFLAGSIDALEKVQHRATKLIPTIVNFPYERF